MGESEKSNIGGLKLSLIEIQSQYCCKVVLVLYLGWANPYAVAVSFGRFPTVRLAHPLWTENKPPHKADTSPWASLMLP
jgi:hypothetical protein